MRRIAIRGKLKLAGRQLGKEAGTDEVRTRIYRAQRRLGSRAARGWEASAEAAAKWQPSEAATFQQWVQRCDGNGGFAVLETDNAADLLKALTIWSSFLEFNVYPVVDIAEATPVAEQALAVRYSVS